MDHEAIFQQIKVESEALEYISGAVERTMAWTVEGEEFSRKLSSVRFITESFQRHLDRLFALEELDGYMTVVRNRRPGLTSKVNGLKRQHDQLRTTVQQLLLQLERASPTDRQNFDGICKDLQKTIGKVRKHNQQENELLLEVVMRDTGGEG